MNTNRYESYTQDVTIPKEGRMNVNFTLMRDDAMHWGSAYDFGIIENEVSPGYRSNEQINSVLAGLENRYPDSAEFSSGENFVSMTIRSLKISDGVCKKIFTLLETLCVRLSLSL